MNCGSGFGQVRSTGTCWTSPVGAVWITGFDPATAGAEAAAAASAARPASAPRRRPLRALVFETERDISILHGVEGRWPPALCLVRLLAGTACPLQASRLT